MRLFRSAAAVLLASALPAIALAQTSQTPDLASLLAQLTALEQQIQSLGAAATTSATTPAQVPAAPASAPAGLCPDLSRALSLGASGADVAGLQTFLGQEGLFKGIATGYFGVLTEAAVSQWQQQNGVVSGGDANSTGLGVVGPKTRVAMEASCLPGASAAATSSECSDVLPPASECSTGWQPISDPNGCTMYYRCTIALPSSFASSTTSTPSITPSSATTSCPFVPKPVCSGTITPFQTDSNGCVTAYECAL